MQFLYVSDTHQVAYSATRSAIGEWMRGEHRWIFLGWLYDGEVTSMAHARQLASAMYARGDFGVCMTKGDATPE